MTSMTMKTGTEARRTSVLDRINEFFSDLASAQAVAAAVEARARPRTSDLVRLGIDPAAFAKIGRA